MKLTSLRALVAAIEDGSLRSAARRLGVSQPALTKMISLPAATNGPISAGLTVMASTWPPINPTTLGAAP
jgi:ABC-type spermidine/putrescine transport system permease subunit II